MTRKEVIAIVSGSFLGGLCLPLIWGCNNHTVQDTTPQVIEILAENCVTIATLHGREDIAKACQLASSGSELLRLILKAQEAKALQAEGPVCPVDTPHTEEPDSAPAEDQ